MVKVINIARETPTVVVVTCEIRLRDGKVVIAVKFPELAVDDVEVLVGEELRDQIDVLLVFEASEDLKEVGAPQLAQGDAARPGGVDAEEDARHHRGDVARVEVGRCLQEGQARVRVHYVLRKRDQLMNVLLNYFSHLDNTFRYENVNWR